MNTMERGAAHTVELTQSECLGLLARTDVGRLAVMEEGFPVAFPVNYRLVPDGTSGAVIVMRTRAGSTLDRPETRAGFEIDGIDGATETGWSVVVRGHLHPADGATAPGWVRTWNPRPWVGDRDTWLYLTPTLITGRRLTASTVTWALALRGYL